MLGTRGVPANHGGFETAAENIGLELVRRGWRVIVYCQESGSTSGVRTDTWNGIERVHLPERYHGPLGTIWFDALSVRHAARYDDLCLTFGYNTAFLLERLRTRGIRTVINMDGVEWKRAKWSRWQRGFLHLNERIAARLGHHLIADHPEIEKHLATIAPAEKLSTITYGAPRVDDADPTRLDQFGIRPGGYLSIVARPAPENSILEMVRAFSRKPRGRKLLVVGEFSTDDEYQVAVRQAAGPEVVFAGPVYDAEILQSIRFHSAAYLHGHTVGGTNPSLVEALGCGNAIIAHDNKYNRWVAQDAALYFRDEDDFEHALTRLCASDSLRADLSEFAYKRHDQEFSWPRITDLYENVLIAQLPQRPDHHPREHHQATTRSRSLSPQQGRAARVLVRQLPSLLGRWS